MMRAFFKLSQFRRLVELYFLLLFGDWVWFAAWFQSFSELFIRFLEKESTPLPPPKLPVERMAREHQEKQQRLFQSSPITADLSSLLTTPETSAEKPETYSHSAVSALFPVEQRDQFVDCKESDISSSNDLLHFVSETGHSKIPVGETSSVLIEWLLDIKESTEHLSFKLALKLYLFAISL